METQISELEPCKLSVNCSASFIEIGDKRDEVLKAFAKAPIKGYRKGVQAPIKLVENQYKNEINDSLKKALAEESYHSALFQHSLRPFGQPKFTSLFLDGGKFTCTFELTVKPKVELKNFREFEIPKPHAKVEASELTEKMLRELQVKFGTTTIYSETDVVENGDSVILDYLGTIDGVKVDSLSAQGELLIVGTSPVAEFDHQLIGLKSGETKMFDILAPETSLPSISNKTVNFTVTITTGSKSTPAALDDNLAKECGKETFAELRELVGQSAMAQAANANQVAMQEAVAKRMVAEHEDIQVPNFMSLSESKYLAYQSQLDWEKMADADKERYLSVATQNVRLALLLDAVREQEPESQLTDQEVFNFIRQNILNTQQGNIDETIEKMNKSGQLQVLMARVKDEQAMQFLTKNVKIVE